jgi:hypothetical protein
MSQITTILNNAQHTSHRSYNTYVTYLLLCGGIFENIDTFERNKMYMNYTELIHWHFVSICLIKGNNSGFINHRKKTPISGPSTLIQEQSLGRYLNQT